NSGLGTLLPGLPSSCRRFVGWATTSGGGVVYGSCDSTNCTCGGPVTISGNMNLYAACEDVPHNVIYNGGNCGNDLTPYTDENALTYGMNPEYSVRSVGEMDWDDISTSQFQGWTRWNDLDNVCATSSENLYPDLIGGNGDAPFIYNDIVAGNNNICSNVDLYAVCCPMNLDWGLDGGSWPTGSSGNQTTCEYGTGGGITPLQTPLKTGYTFTGWKVTDYSTP
ncbi:MAG: hypothetical protein MJ163_00120, partial [Alphaproteobacteria bacterium]|nr:hypothetical protein [Alphaproteobacteria bacterium]